MREVTIGTRHIRITASAYTSIAYQNMFQSIMIKDAMEIEKKLVEWGNGSVEEQEAAMLDFIVDVLPLALQCLYCMYAEANPNCETYETFTKSLIALFDDPAWIRATIAEAVLPFRRIQPQTNESQQ